MKEVFKQFRPSSWAIDNKTSIYIITIFITIAGLMTYNSLPKEQFPEVVFPQIMVNTVYPGTSPTDMENLVTRHIEKRVKAISGVKKVTSNSVQNFSSVMVEFNTDVDVADAKQKVKDEVDKAKTDLPPLQNDPEIMDIDISQMPIMNINLSGDYDLDKLKKFADDVKDRVEGMKEITRVDIVGALEREIKVDVDMYRMEVANITMFDIENAIRYENMTLSGGEVRMDDMKRSINVKGEFKDPMEVGNLILRGQTGSVVYLKDIAQISDGFKEKESYARLDGKNVITLNVIKRTGENLISASDKIKEICDDLQENKFPKGLDITLTGDQSETTRVTLHDLINTIIIGFILVTVILMFFMGATNAIFVAMSVPLSMAIAFMVMPVLGTLLDFNFTLNMMVLFSLLLALGIVVDDAIVVIENTHRVFDNGKVPIKTAAKKAAGEVFLPVLSGTLTTLAPFIPLLAWQGVIGKFMFYLPVTLIVTLMASLVVAYIINPVFAVDFMKPHDHTGKAHKKITRGFKITSIVFAALALLLYVTGNHGGGNLMVTFYALFCLNKFVLTDVISKFQNNVWPRVQNGYARLIRWALEGVRPRLLLWGTIGLFFLSFVITAIAGAGVVFFPQSDPNFIFTYVNLPIGTDQVYTDSITHIIEKKVTDVVHKDHKDGNPIVKSIISNVGFGAGDPSSFDMSLTPHKGKVTVAFVEFAHRDGQSTRDYLDKIREAVKGIPGAEITVEQEQGGPPTGKPINIEIAGDEFDELTLTSKNLKRYLDSLQIPGVEELKSDLQSNKPEILITIDRERANREGISTGQIGNEIRKAVYGLDQTSKFRDGNEEHPIQLRYLEEQRNNPEALMNLKITYRDMNMGGIVRQIPLSSVADISYVNSYGGIKRKNEKRVVTVASNILSGHNPNEVVAKVQAAVDKFPMPSEVTVSMTGEQEEQKETAAFLGWAGLTALGLILLILVLQFNSISKPIIILVEILFSIIGVLLGFVIFRMEFSIIMTGVGIIALAGIVVRNGILLVEFTDILMARGMELKEAIIEAGRTRMTPVLLTAFATMLGLIPLAVGLNIDFVSLFTDLDPKIYFGGDSVAFWGPLSWTMIFGLAFGTFLTLILVPVMYLMSYRTSKGIKKALGIKPKELQAAEEPQEISSL